MAVRAQSSMDKPNRSMARVNTLIRIGTGANGGIIYACAACVCVCLEINTSHFMHLDAVAWMDMDMVVNRVNIFA